MEISDNSGSGGGGGNPPPEQPTNEPFDQPAVGDSIEIETVGPLQVVPGLYLDLETPDGDSSTYEVISVDPGDLNVINARLVDAGTIAPGAAVPSGATLRTSQTLAKGMAYVGAPGGYSVPLVVETAPVVIEANQATMSALPQQRQGVVVIPDALVITEVEQPLPAAPLVGDRVVLSRGSNVTTELLVTPPVGYTIANQSEYRLPKTPQANAVLQYMGNNKWNLLAGASGGTTTPSSGKVEFWIPNPMKWENISASQGVNAPLKRGPIWRIGDTLYMFGGFTSGMALSNKIYTAPWPGDSGNLPVFVDSGATLPAAKAGLRVMLIDDTLYAFGDQEGGQAIWSAPVATPLVWTDTGASVGVSRAVAGFFIAGDKIGILGGWNGSAGQQTARWTSIATPTGVWATSAQILPLLAWEAACCVVGDDIVWWGGFNNQNTIQWGSVETFPTLGFTQSLFGVNVKTCPDLFHLGDEIASTGSTGSSEMWTASVDIYRLAKRWVNKPEETEYCYGASWIGGDGRMYYVGTVLSGGNLVFYRSGRSKVYVDAAQVAAAGPYDGLRGVYADGTPAFVSTHVRMANRPWLTNRRDAY